MKSVISALVLLGVVAFPFQVLADRGDSKGPSENAYEHANENARFKRGDDWQQDKKLKLDKAEDKETRHGGRDENQDDDGDGDQFKHEKKKEKTTDKVTGKKAKK
jgi:hypothetical protein